jgi:hypothetical protein
MFYAAVRITLSLSFVLRCVYIFQCPIYYWIFAKKIFLFIFDLLFYNFIFISSITFTFIILLLHFYFYNFYNFYFYNFFSFISYNFLKTFLHLQFIFTSICFIFLLFFGVTISSTTYF